MIFHGRHTSSDCLHGYFGHHHYERKKMLLCKICSIWNRVVIFSMVLFSLSSLQKGLRLGMTLPRRPMKRSWTSEGPVLTSITASPRPGVSTAWTLTTYGWGNADAPSSWSSHAFFFVGAKCCSKSQERTNNWGLAMSDFIEQECQTHFRRGPRFGHCFPRRAVLTETISRSQE